MDVRLLGPVEASVDGRVVAVGAGKPRALLALLALHAGSTVSSERLIEGLWGERPPATAVKLVQLHVSQLRKAFTAAATAADRHARSRLRAAARARRPRRHALRAARGRPASRARRSRCGAAHRSTMSPASRSRPPRSAGWRSCGSAAVELAIELDLAAGRHREVVGELERLVLEEPLRETLHAQRMLALYRSGRQADALAAYRQARAALVERMGVEPGPELRELHEAILRQDESLEAVARRVGDAASRVAAERAALRLVEDEVVSGVVELQARRRSAAPTSWSARSRGWRRSTSTTPATSSAASDSSRSWSRGWPAPR